MNDLIWGTLGLVAIVTWPIRWKVRIGLARRRWARE